MRPIIQGILAALVGMLVLMTWRLGRVALVDLPSLALMGSAAVALIAFKANLAWVVAAVACLSLALF